MKNKIKILIGLSASVFIVWFLVFSQQPNRILEVNFLDVGQGDAILIKTPKNQTILIDGGPNNKVLEKLGEYLSPLSKRIDIVLLTHPHADHVVGLIEVLRRYDVGLVILSGAELGTDIYSEFLKEVEEKSIQVLIAEAGTAIHFGDDLEFDIISPNKDLTNSVFGKNSEGFGSAGGDVNDTSIVGKLIFSAKGGSQPKADQPLAGAKISGGNNFSILFMGDATSKIENQLLAYGDNLKSDILKVGHHGSKYSSFPVFLKMVSAQAGIIEVGAKNFYSHPSPAALNRFANLNMRVFQTGKNGDIRVFSDGFTTNIFPEH